MNKSYRIVWNHARRCLMVVSEATKSHGKAGGAKAAVLTGVAAAIAALGAVAAVGIGDAQAATAYVLPDPGQYPNYDTTLLLGEGDSLQNNAGSVGGSVPVGISASGVTMGTVSGQVWSIANGGTISATAPDPSGDLSTGIYVDASTLSGGISNTASAKISGLDVGVWIGSSTVRGNLINRGEIQATAKDGDWGVVLNKTTLNGSLINSGLIQSPGNALNLQGRATVTGSIINTVSGTQTGTMSGRDAILISNALVQGGISNAGKITATNNGIYLQSGASVEGGIHNALGGEISGQHGILISSSNVSGAINNQAGATISTGNGPGIAIWSDSNVTGGITNAGSIIAGGDSWYGAVYIGSGSSVSGGIHNLAGGLITGGSATLGAIAMYSGGALSGGIVNEGTITAIKANGIGLMGSTVTGGITNSGTINGFDATHSGIFVGVGSSIDSITNTGVISGAGVGIFNAGSIGSLANAQGNVTGGVLSGALTYKGKLPTSYTTLFKSTTQYGQLSFGTYSGTMTFAGIGTISGGALAAGTYTGVLQGISYTGLGLTAATSTETGTFGNYTWTLSDANTDLIWDLVLTSATPINTTTISSALTATQTMAGGDGLLVTSGGSVSVSGSNDAVIVPNGVSVGGIDNQGTLIGGLNANGIRVDGTVAGGITNSGLIDAGGSGIVLAANSTLAGGIINSATGSISGIDLFSSKLSDGITNAGTITGNSSAIAIHNGSTVVGGITTSGLISAGTDAIYIDTGASVDNIVIDGKNTASFVGNVTAPNTPVTVAGGATYTLDTNFTTPTFINQGTLIVPASSTSSITGNLTLDSGGTFSPTVASTTNYSQLSVSGDVNIAGALAVKAASISGTIAKGTTLTGVITAGNSLTGTFGSYSTDSRLYSFTPVYDTNSLGLLVEQKAGASIANSTAAEGNKAGAGAAATLDVISGMSGTMSAVTDAFGRMTSDGQISNAVSQTLPVMSGATTINTLSVLSGINRIIEARNLRNRGISTGDNFYNGSAAWIKPFGSWVNQGNQNGAYGFKANTGGLMLGADTIVQKDLRLGAAVAWGNTYATSNAGVAPQSQTSNLYQFIGYGSYAITDSLEANFQANGGWNSNTTNRQIGFMGTSAQGSYNSAVWHIGAGLSNPFQVAESTQLIPSARFDYSWIRNNSYSESGASNGLGLNVAAQTYESSVLSADGKIVHKLNDHHSVSANLGVGYNFSPTQTTVAAAFQGAPSLQFTTNGVNPSATMGRAGAGYTYKVKENVDVGIRYDIDFQSQYTNQIASAKARWMF